MTALEVIRPRYPNGAFDDFTGWLRVTTAAISFAGGVEHSLTQKPWRPAPPSSGSDPHPELISDPCKTVHPSSGRGFQTNVNSRGNVAYLFASAIAWFRQLTAD